MTVALAPVSVATRPLALAPFFSFLYWLVNKEAS